MIGTPQYSCEHPFITVTFGTLVTVIYGIRAPLLGGYFFPIAPLADLTSVKLSNLRQRVQNTVNPGLDKNGGV